MLSAFSRAAAVCLALALVACMPGPEGQLPPARHRVVYGLTLMPSGFDPHIHASSELGIPLRQVYDTLVYRDPTSGEFVPGLATSWDVSDDGLAYTFRLREDVKFHDDTMFTAQSVASNLDRIMDPNTGSQKARFLLGPYAGHDILDQYTIRLDLSEPYSPLLDSLSQVYLGMASPTAFAQYSTNRYQFHQVGTGPFVFHDYIPGDHITLRRNPDYAWGPAFYAAATEQSVDEIVFRFFEDEATRALALESGEAQVMGELPPVEARAVTANNTLQVMPESIPGQPLQFLMNTRRYPTDNRAVRQALLYAANRNVIVDSVFQRFSPVAWGPLSADNLYYNPAVAGAYAHDTAQAAALLEEAGYADTDGNGYVDFAGVELTVDVIVPPWGLIPQVAQLLQDQWRTIGVRVSLQSVPTRGALLQAVADGQYNLVAYYSFGVDPAFLSDFFSTNGPNNWTGYSNPDLDLLFVEASRQPEPAVRRDLYGQAQATIMNEALILPIRDYVNLTGASATLENLSFDAYGWNPILNNLTVRLG